MWACRGPWAGGDGRKVGESESLRGGSASRGSGEASAPVEAVANEVVLLAVAGVGGSGSGRNALALAIEDDALAPADAGPTEAGTCGSGRRGTEREADADASGGALTRGRVVSIESALWCVRVPRAAPGAGSAVGGGRAGLGSELSASVEAGAERRFGRIGLSGGLAGAAMDEDDAT
jgi:hypothetical protein